MEQLAQQLYDAYGASTNYRNFMGNPMPAWADLPEGVRNAWVATAEAATRLLQR